VWTHVDDTELIGDDRLLLSPRNFEQAFVVDTESKQILDPFRSDGDYDVMHEPHSLDWIKSIVENTLTHHDVRCTSEVTARL
jgi:hypothetical protein